MFRRHLSISLVLLAYSILLAHNCVPHHHHFAAENQSLQFDKSHATDNEEDDRGFLNHAFSHFQHDQGAEMTKMSLEKNDINKQLHFAKTFIPFISTFLLKVDAEQRPVYLPPSHSLFLYAHFYSAPNLQRGPPAFTV